MVGSQPKSLPSSPAGRDSPRQGRLVTPVLDTITIFSLSANEVGEEGRGEVARLNLNPLAPALSPLGRGEGVGVKLHPPSQHAVVFSLAAQAGFFYSEFTAVTKSVTGLI